MQNLSCRRPYINCFMKGMSRSRLWPWIKFVKNLLCSLGFPVIWYSQSFINANWIVKAVNQKLKDVFIQLWRSKIGIESDSNIYRVFKVNFEQSPYIKLLSINLCKTFLRYRTRNHRLPTEIGRWRGIPYNDRLCNFCQQTIGDEYHTVLECPHFITERRKYVKRQFYNHPNTLKFESLMNCTNKNVLANLCNFVKIILKSSTSV